MRYTKWNNILAKFFFNEEKCDKEVKLFITKNDILNLADKNQIHNGWEDFINSLNGIAGDPNKSFITRFIQHYEKKEDIFQFCGETVKYPPQISLLSFLTLPFTEVDNTAIHGSAYYPRINKFLSNNNINYSINLEHLKCIDVLWKDLEEWTLNNEGRFGIFMIPDLGFQFVGKPFAQCLIRPTESKLIPKLFADYGFIPKVNLSGSTFKAFILENLNKLKINNHRKKIEDNHPLGKAFINLIKAKFQEWNGETDIIETDIKSSRAGKVIVRALAQLKYVERSKKWISYIRLNSGLPYPDNVSLFNYEIYEIFNGYSNQVPVEHLDSVSLSIEDTYNKIQIRYKDSTIRLFVKGSKFGLSNKFFLEIDYLNKIDDFLVLVKSHNITEFTKWAEINCGKVKKEETYPSPYGNQLYRISQPILNKDLPLDLLFSPDEGKKILFEYGVKLNSRTFLINAKPRIRVINATGLEKILIEYVDNNLTGLIQDKEFKDIWTFPDTCIEDIQFKIYIDGESSNKKYLFVSSGTRLCYANNKKIPKRNKYGKIEPNIKSTFFQGNSVVDQEESLNWNILNSYNFDYYKSYGESSSCIEEYIIEATEEFLYYLTEKGRVNYQNFSEAFDYYFNPDERKDTGLAKWLTIRYLEILGYIDFNRPKKTIHICQSQLIYVPHNNKGYEFILVGGRSSKLISKLVNICNENGFNFSVLQQKENYYKYLIPHKISIANVEPSDLTKLRYAVTELNILFSNRFEQIAITNLFSGTVDEYRKLLYKIDPQSNFNKYLFDLDSLAYKPIENQNGLQHGLVKHELNSFTRFFVYWKNGIPKEVDETWENI